MNRVIYRVSIPLLVFLIISFVLLANNFLSSEKSIIAEAEQRGFKKVEEQFEKDRDSRLKEERKYLELLTNMITRVSTKYLYDYEIDAIKKPLLESLDSKSIRAILVYDQESSEVFSFIAKVDGKVVDNKEYLKELESNYKFLQRDILVENQSKKIGYVKVFYSFEEIIKSLKKSEKMIEEGLKKESRAQEESLNETIFSQISFMVFIAVTLFAVLFFMLYKIVINPLQTLNKGLQSFFNFLQNKSDNTQRIEINSKDEFGAMAKSLNENISVSAKLHEEIYQLNVNLEEKIEQRTHELNEKSKKVELLLDNADQGFLSFGKDMKIHKEYSKECFNIFKQEIADLDISKLLFKDEKKREFFMETLNSLLGESNKQKIKTIFSLLQSEFIINKKAIHLKYKIIDEETFMIILTDITAKKVLEKKINKERSILKMIVSVVSDIDEFFELNDDFMNFINSYDTLIDEHKTTLNNATHIYRVVHTFKGLFAQKDMRSIVKKLHILESELSDTLASPLRSNVELKELIASADLSSYYLKDLNTIKDVLGEEIFLKRGKIEVKEENISEIEEKIIKIATRHKEMDEYKDVIDELRHLKYKSLSSMFSSYPKLVNQLSERLNKSIYPLEIITDKELRVPDEYKNFIRGLIHIFRNSIDHGIESMDERYEMGKDEIGTITCTITKKEKNLHFIIADDGRGLDIEKISQKAEMVGIDTTKMGEDEIINLIFRDEFSTKESIDEISGRGVGLAAVKEELESLNGVVHINSQKDIGTTFEFIVPFS